MWKMCTETFESILNDDKKWNKTEKKKEKESWGKSSTGKSDSSENEIAYLSSLTPFEFEPKTNIRDINSSSDDDEEESNEDKVKQIKNGERCE